MLDLITRFLEPMVVTLKLFESDRSTLSSIYYNFKKMMNSIQEISCNFSTFSIFSGSGQIPSLPTT